MEFPDFLEFEAFNRLRQQMGAETLGQFEFFDPSRHLSAEERLQLQNGLVLPKSQVTIRLDHTLAYKNGRVLVSVLRPGGEGDWCYHPAACAVFEQMRGEVRASTREPVYKSGNFKVCIDCLQLLRYKGFDVVRNRHRYYSQRLHEEFDLEEFFHHYPLYPLRDDHQKTNVVI